MELLHMKPGYNIKVKSDVYWVERVFMYIYI